MQEYLNIPNHFLAVHCRRPSAPDCPLYRLLQNVVHLIACYRILLQAVLDESLQSLLAKCQACALRQYRLQQPLREARLSEIWTRSDIYKNTARA